MNRTIRLLATTATAALAATTLGATSASAGGFGPIDLDFDTSRFESIDEKPCDRELVKQYVCSPDYSVEFVGGTSTIVRDGEAVRVRTLVIRNESKIQGSPDLGTVLRRAPDRYTTVEHVAGNRDWVLTPGIAPNDTLVRIVHPNGLGPGESTTVRISLMGPNYGDTIAKVNAFSYYDCCGTRTAFDHLEPDYSNNWDVSPASGK